MNKVFLISINDNFQIDNQILKLLSQERVNKINKFRFEEDKKRSIYAELLLKFVIQKNLNIKSKEIEFFYNEFGKPFVKGLNNKYFNISHSGEWVVFAYSDKNIGIDIELMEFFDLSIAKNLFAKSEYLDVLSLKNEADQKNLFFNIWTLKESYIKYVGKGLGIPLDSFEFKMIGEKIFFKSEYNVNPNFFNFSISQDYKLSICSENISLEPFQYLNIDEIVYFLK